MPSTNSVLGGSRRSLTPPYWTAIILATITGTVHLWVGVTDGKLPLAIAGIGFAVGITTVALDIRRQQMVKLGIPYTAGQVVLYVIGHYPDEFSVPGLTDKAIQMALVAVLVMILRRN